MNRHLFRTIRRLNGDTQERAAKRLGVSQSAISKIETGEIRRMSKTHSEALRRYAMAAVRVILEPFGLRIEGPH
jgi:transcriptional regulator with XRE-family HTH domain